ncbi:peptidase S14 [Gilvimarinus agarilyticus]|uniref:peptidase S14 n=1 Tax=unclassified Gilvimarinus TaxID=2642066 RepID=UPI001C0905F2|nr:MULTISPECIES: peptidase S14 [unclassified Gilvimarinus]MBU2885599.1 peptidase S14 [Gilvimarinus agarilyticus]MDO6570466.1 peptidase S14 [Gilvimarinus sp. 2_MG-2023]MDO6746517.1 peptidase S14 [Gilvimarinus sp. 1_MG-2023]
MKASEFLKKYEQQQSQKEDEEHSLQHQARERAAHLEEGLNVGSPYDWEDLEKYKKELARMDREGPGKK